MPFHRNFKGLDMIQSFVFKGFIENFSIGLKPFKISMFFLQIKVPLEFEDDSLIARKHVTRKSFCTKNDGDQIIGPKSLGFSVAG